MSKIFPVKSYGNAAPNYVPQTEMRVPFSLDPRPSAALGTVVSRAQIGTPSLQNLTPYINGQTLWALNQYMVKTPQGMVRVQRK